ncbi:MAG TPA: urea ABC transporter permease subunit UrtB [Rhodocyclaceae bacterium]|nr:urea ABC transporter permease subunit UrtB [Rhodocyclaceae bacterium]
MKSFVTYALTVLLALCSLNIYAADAVTPLDPALVAQLAAEESDDKIVAIQKLGTLASPEAARVLKALGDDALFSSGEGKTLKVFFMEGDKAIDAATGAEITPAPENPEGISINNRIRTELDAALAGLRLFDPDYKIRLAAAKELQNDPSPELAPIVSKALSSEKDAKIKKLLVLVDAQINLKSEDSAVRLAAVQALADSSNSNTRNLLAPMIDEANEPDSKIRLAAFESLRAVEKRLAWGDAAARIFSGLSLGSILLLAALGLAITYGVMGVINMAHGELLMVGAYATFGMQSVFRHYFTAYEDWYVVAAIPAAFFAAALVGVILERTVIRFLYGRPLETLLATWGISLFLIQAARVLFGAQNVEVSNPSWMSGGVEVFSGVMLPWNRVFIIGFSMFVLLLVWALMKKTRLGMFVRAVTQNRPMAGCVGVPTSRIDTLAFALGAGIAGLGGVALSQIANVGPDMGQGYIVDSFLVVVLGGGGQLAGAVWAALGLGIVTKFIEGWLGAVIAKILVLVFIIIFIQKRPQGLFALKGRFVDS